MEIRNKQVNGGGILVISLDFELYWGMRGKVSLESYRENLLGVRQAVPNLLKLFQEYGIHVTWATVGFLFYESRQELEHDLPVKKPIYENIKLSPYEYIKSIGRDEREDPFHFAPSLIKMIASSPHQEIATHTFSHYYCLEKGQTSETFRYDLEAAIKIANKNNIETKSIVFPRNRINQEYLSICKEFGIKAYRGNEAAYFYRGNKLFSKELRFLDSLVNISGNNSYSLAEIRGTTPFCIAASRLLRPYMKKYPVLASLRLRRILSDLSFAAREGRIFHLWWHPHNFGVDLRENLGFLKQILDHFVKMKEKFGMESLNMREVAARLSGEVSNG